MRPGRLVRVGEGTVELPVLYFRDDAFTGLFTASYEAIRQLMPSDRLYPAQTIDGRGLVVVTAFNYLDTTVGPYGELAVAPVVVHGDKKPPRSLPGWLESAWPGCGGLVMHLPVTSQQARDAGRELWGFTKFIADMHFTNTPERLACRLEEQGQHILTLTIAKRGLAVPDRRPVVTYSVKNGDLIRTRIPQISIARMSIGGRDSLLELGEGHPVAESLRALAIDPQPVRTRYLLEHSFALPEGEVIERNVRRLDGYAGTARDHGELEVTHPLAATIH
ncbi:MAG TPA: acetoacetate decarboxylase family protein [Kofleriaceae bacterium]|nr:acetoacetate decarboxylase family protein [Kofleriaceae bacterium]